MSEKPWPNEWPNPDTHKKKEDPSAVERLNSSTTAIFTAITVLALVLLTRSAITWLTTPPPTPPPPTPRPIIIEPAPDLPTLSNHSCTINLHTHEHNCHHLSPLRFERPLRDGRAVIKLTLDPFTTGYTAARFAVTYGAEISGWTLNIGDSPTNGGYAGDAGTHSNDAELQILHDQLTVYGNDYTQPAQTTDGHRQITAVEQFVAPHETVLFEVSNQQLWWLTPAGQSTVIEGPFLYALARQPDEEGETNYDLYAAFNQVISGSGRTGRGVEQVTITLIPTE